MVLVLVIEAIGEWIAFVGGRASAALHESPYVGRNGPKGIRMVATRYNRFTGRPHR